MPTSVTMPQLGESVTEGTITRWLKNVGDTVEVDEPLLEISTDKVDTEIPSPAAGVLTEIHAQEDDTVEIGGALATIGDAGAAPAGDSAPAAPAAEPEPAPAPEPAPQAAAPAPVAPPAPPVQQAPPPPAPAAPAPVAPAAPQPVAQGSDNGVADSSAYVTPLVRKLAAEHSVDVSNLSGTGVGGRIRKQDILEAAEQQKAAAQQAAQPVAEAKHAAPKAAVEASPLRGNTEKLSRLRALIGRRMVESLQTTAQLTSVVEVDITRIAKLRQDAKASFQARHGVKLSFLPFFVAAAVEALPEHPKLNASVDDEAGTITYYDAEHLSLAVDTERGLITPVIRDAGDLNLAGIARKIADLAARGRDNKLGPDELAGGTFTVTNTGSRGALFDTPILNKPQTAILGTGAVVKRAVVVDDEKLGEIIVPRSMVYLSLTYDHRVVDGADAARYLVAVKERLEAGDFAAELGLTA